MFLLTLVRQKCSFLEQEANNPNAVIFLIKLFFLKDNFMSAFFNINVTILLINLELLFRPFN